MTSCTATIKTEFSGAAEGARRATGAVPENSRFGSSQPIVVLGHRQLIDVDKHLLPGRVNRGDKVLVNRFRRQRELLAENIQQPVTADETHHMITAGFGLRQRVAWGGVRIRKANQVPTLLKHRQRRFPFQLAIAIPTVVLLLKEQRLWTQLVGTFHRYPAQEPAAIVIIALLDHAVTPRLSHRNEPPPHSSTPPQPHPTPNTPTATPTP